MEHQCLSWNGIFLGGSKQMCMRASICSFLQKDEWMRGRRHCAQTLNVPEDRVDCIRRRVYSVTKFTWIHCVHCSWSSKLLTCFDVGQCSSDLVRIKLIDSTNNNPQISVIYSKRILLFAPVSIQWVTFHMFIQGSKLLPFCGFFSFMVLST